MLDQLAEGVPQEQPIEAALPQSPMPQEDDGDIFDKIAAPPQQQQPPTQQQQEQPDPNVPKFQIPGAQPQPQAQEPKTIMDKPLDQITMAEFMKEFYKEKAQPSQNEPQEGPPEEEEEEYEAQNEEELSEPWKQQVKTMMPYLEDDDVNALASFVAKQMRPVVEYNVQLFNKIKSLEKSIEPFQKTAESQKNQEQNNLVRAQMSTIHPDFQQYEPAMQAFYEANIDNLNRFYNFEELPKPVKAELLFGIVKSMGSPAPQALERVPTAPMQMRRQVSTIQPPPVNMPGPAQGKPVDRLMGDVLAYLDGKESPK